MHHYCLSPRKANRRFHFAGVALLLLGASAVQAQQPAAQTSTPAPKLTGITSKPGPTLGAFDVTVSGSGLTGATFIFTPAKFIIASISSSVKPTDTSITATFTLSGHATGIVKVQVKTPGGTSNSEDFDTGIVCLDSIHTTGGCQLRWEVETTTATGSSTSTANKTAPNILAKLDYQWHTPKSQPKDVRKARENLEKVLQGNIEAMQQALSIDAKALDAQDSKDLKDLQAAPNDTTKLNAVMAKAEPLAQKNVNDKVAHAKKTSTSDHISVHVYAEAGYTQVPTSTKLQSTNTSGGTNSTTTSSGGTNSEAIKSAATSSGGTTSGTTSSTPLCSSASSTSGSSSTTTNTGTSSTCNAATQQQAFVVNAGATAGYVMGRKGQGGIFTEIGVAGKGSFQYLIPANQVVNNGNLDYIQLTSFNPRDVVGTAEATGHFNVSQWGHNQQASSNFSYHNVTSLLKFEAGYQYNTGLQQLATSATTNTRNRFVGRFSISPQLNNSNHTTVTLGVEYSAGISGGAHVVQFFIGGNLNPTKLLNPSKSPSSNQNASSN